MTQTSHKAPLNPYDELPYFAYPIEWTAPERLALASLLHGGPRLSLDSYRVLEGQDSWGPLAIADGYMVMRDSKSMVCLDIAKARQ